MHLVCNHCYISGSCDLLFMPMCVLLSDAGLPCSLRAVCCGQTRCSCCQRRCCFIWQSNQQVAAVLMQMARHSGTAVCTTAVRGHRAGGGIQHTHNHTHTHTLRPMHTLQLCMHATFIHLRVRVLTPMPLVPAVVAWPVNLTGGADGARWG